MTYILGGQKYSKSELESRGKEVGLNWNTVRKRIQRLLPIHEVFGPIQKQGGKLPGGWRNNNRLF